MIPSVWAPIPQQVRLWVQVPGGEARVEPMHPLEGGWWTWEGADLGPDTRYGFLLDDDDAPLPDPRGRRLPDGVHGTSAVVAEPEPPAEGWAGGWRGRDLAGGVIAEVHVGTFTPDGTLDSAVERLDHLVDTGIDFVELLPVNAFNGEWNWGYDGVAWYAVQESYGGPDAYRRFVAAAHERGLAVIQDVVYNHLGPSGNYLPRFGPYLRTGSRNTWGDSVNLDESAVRDYILDNARMWVTEYGVDGLRLDAVHALLDDPSANEREVHILRELGDLQRELTDTLGRAITFIAESDLNDPVMIDAPDADGHGLRAQWSDDYHHAVHVALTGETAGYYGDFAPLSALAKASGSGFFHDGTFSSFREREHGRPIPEHLSPTSLVTFSQDHDQIGNRAAGDRLSQTLSPRRLAVGAVLTICSPFTPMIFMGEEWGASTPWQFFTSHPEPELGRIVAEGRIAEFEKMGWDRAVVPDPQDPATFQRSKLDWSELERSPHRELFAVYRELIALRRAEPDLGGVGFRELTADADDDARTFTLRMGSIGVLANLGDAAWTPTAEAGGLLFRTSDEVAEHPLVLPPESAVVVRLA